MANYNNYGSFKFEIMENGKESYITDSYRAFKSSETKNNEGR